MIDRLKRMFWKAPSLFTLVLFVGTFFLLIFAANAWAVAFCWWDYRGAICIT